MRSVAPDARAKWLAMVHEQAAAFARETALLRRDLQPIFFVGAESVAGEELTIASDADLAVTSWRWQITMQLERLSSSLPAVLRER
jgi:hypothetical protein